MDERFYILHVDFDFFVVDSTFELKPFIISDVKYIDVIDWFEKGYGIYDDISLSKITLNDDESLFCAHMNCPKYDFGFSISALSKKHLYDIMEFLHVHNKGW